MCSWSMPKAAPEDILVKISAVNRGTGRGRAASPADALVPQRLGVVDCAIQPRRREADPQAGRGAAGASAVAATHPLLGEFGPFLRGRRAAALHRERNEQRAAFPRREERGPLRQGRHQQLRRPRQTGRREPREARAPRSRRTTRSTSAPGRSTVIRLRLSQGVCGARRPRVLRTGRSTRSSRTGFAKPTSSITSVTPPSLECRRGERHAPGPRRHALEQAVLLLRRRQLAGRAQLQPAPSRISTPPGTRSGSTC